MVWNQFKIWIAKSLLDQKLKIVFLQLRHFFSQKISSFRKILIQICNKYMAPTFRIQYIRTT